MNFCILRAKKLSTFGSIAGSAKHTFREIPTPNVDATRTHLNWTSGGKSSDEVCNAVKALLPAKRRKDAVLCIEYLVTASPEWFKATSEKEQIQYFNGAIAWLRKRHGANNIVCLNWQKDETSPHLVAYAVPLTKDGRLSAKDFLGGRTKLSTMQTDFWTQVGRPAGLQRGLEGSTAKHVTAKQYSAALAKNPTLVPPMRPEPTVADRFTGRAKDMEAAHNAATAEFAQLVEQGRNEVLQMKKSRDGQALELLALRADKEELRGLKKEIQVLASENAGLRAKLKSQKEYFVNQIGVLRLSLNQATTRISQLLVTLGMQTRKSDKLKPSPNADQHSRPGSGSLNR